MSQTEVLRVDARQPETKVLERAAAVLRRGGLVAFPTETVYGLAADALQEAAVQRIFAAKGRPARNPVIVHVASAPAARALAADWPPTAELLAAHFWPGSLTLVVPRRQEIPDAVAAGGDTVGLRVPAHPVALALIEAAGVPLAAPSANRSNGLSPTLADHVAKDLGGRIDLILDGGPAWGGLESTVLDLTTSPPRLLRPGLVTPAAIEAVIGPIARGQPESERAAGEAFFRSPGMMPKHYAPRAALECVPGAGDRRVAELAAAGARVGWLTFGSADVTTGPAVLRRVMPADAVSYARLLYTVLHELDAAGVDRIVVELPPPGDEWLAVRDRLQRAAAT